MRIKVTIGKLEVFANLNNSKTAKAIWESLPFEARSELWGDEVYFFVKPQVKLEKEYAHNVVELGDVAYWPQGPCMCLFFGMTPNSRDGKIMPASAVNVFGKLEGDSKVLKNVKEGDIIKINCA